MLQQLQPEAVRGSHLDLLLHMGWYRMGQTMFTIHYIHLENRYIRVFWLRYKVSGFSFSKAAERIGRSLKDFDVSILPLALTQEHEELYAKYVESINFETSSSPFTILFDKPWHPEWTYPNVFDSYMIEVRDGKKLIACGVFDRGRQASAGILNFFDPEYKKFSPGKALMVAKLKKTAQWDMAYYYPGYIAARYSKFDYKLFLNPEMAEIYDPISQEWLPYSSELVLKLEELQLPYFSFPTDLEDPF